MKEDPPSYDNDLLARLNALRSTNVSFDKPTTPLSVPRPEQTPDTDLSARLKLLRAKNEGSSAAIYDDVVNRKAIVRSPRTVVRTSHGEEANLDLPSTPTSLGTEKRSAAHDILDKSARAARALAEDFGRTKFGNDDEEDEKLGREALALTQNLPKEANEVEKEDAPFESDANKKQMRKDSEKLSKEAVKALKRSRAVLERSESEKDGKEGEEEDGEEVDGKTTLPRIPKALQNESDSENHYLNEDEEADLILAQLMDEVTFDLGSEPETEPKDTAKGANKKLDPDHMKQQPESQKIEDDDAFAALMSSRLSALRTPPATTKQPTTNSLDLPCAPPEEPVDSLGLPTAPTLNPSFKAPPPPIPVEKEHICKICYAPGTVLCTGCLDMFAEEGVGEDEEDATFCARCWKEGHLGDAAVGGERYHKFETVERSR